MLGANGGGEAVGTVGSIMLAAATLTMCHGDVPRDMRAETYRWGIALRFYRANNTTTAPTTPRRFRWSAIQLARLSKS